jgi:hypothetical protein
MAKQVNLHGARAKLGIYNKNTGKTQYVGIFNSVSVTNSYGADPAWILGRLGPDTITYTSADVVSIQASGWRVLRNGRHKGGGMPALGDLLSYEAFTMVVTDRQLDDNGEEPRILTFKEVYPTSSTEGYSARELASISISYIALTVDDEDTVNEEVGAMTMR